MAFSGASKNEHGAPSLSARRAVSRDQKTF
jgi:hypothetical protein